ncbi:hypothetical protein DB347_24830 [Opitutaceae bacterium EW11]|nr:hypothetical protein DB347_24830 [Opitutaceae bacterium EW11]
MRLSLTLSIIPLATLLAAGASAETAFFLADGEALALNRFEVTDSPVLPADSTTLKLPIALHETPRSVTVLTADRIAEQDFQRLEDTFRYVPGVFSRSQDGDSYHFLSRGFDMGPDETKIDGFSGLLAGGTFSPTLFGIEQVVYLRGPAGIQYGAAATPGGVINLITKKPLFTGSFNRVDARYSTYAGSGLSLGDHPSELVSIETNQLLGTGGAFAYRIAAQAQNQASYKDGILDRQRAFLAALTWKFGRGQRFSITPLIEYQKQPFGAGRAVSISPSTSLTTNDGAIGSIHTDDLSPLALNLASGSRILTHQMAGLDFSAELGDGWRLLATYRYLRADSDANQFTPQTASLRQLDPANPRSWVIDRRQTVSQTDRRNHAFDVQTTYELRPTEAVSNLTQLGINGRFFRTTASRSAATQPNQSPINVYTGAELSPLVDAQPRLVDSYLSDDFYWNLYAQNQTRIADRWVVTAGAGYGEQRYGRSYPAGQLPPANLDQILATRRGDVTPNAAVVFNVSRHISLYASYSTSYSPAPGDYEDARGETGNFSPTTGSNYETGAKLDWPEHHASATLSVFQTELDNVLVQSEVSDLNPRGNRYYVQTGGGRRTRGAEFSAEYRPVPAWRLQATGSYLDARYRGEGRLPGSRAERTPPWAFSLYQRYDLSSGPLKNLGFSTGLIWQDKRWSAARTAAAPDPLLLPSYTRVDLGLYYRLGAHWDFALHVENALNEVYFVNGTTGAALELGAPRSISLRAGYRF